MAEGGTPDIYIAQQVHAIASQAPLTVRGNKIVPEEGVITRAPENLRGNLKEFFQSEARPATRPMAVLPPPGVDTKDGKLFLMIDPHAMSAGMPYGSRIGQRQTWETARKRIEESGGSVETLRGADPAGGTRETFTRDRYVLGPDGRAYLPDVDAYRQIAGKAEHTGINAMADEYGAEIDQARNFLNKKGVPNKTVKGAWFEGGNVIIDPKSKTVFMGLETDWDNSGSTKKLVEAININAGSDASKRYTAFGVPLVNQNTYYHLDMGMSDPLPKGKNEILMSPHVTDPQTIHAIEGRIGKDRVMRLDPSEPVASTNFVTPTTDTIVPTTMSDKLKETLGAKGYQIVGPEYGDLMIGFGGVRCMTNQIPTSAAMLKQPSPQGPN